MTGVSMEFENPMVWQVILMPTQRVSPKLKMGNIKDEFSRKASLSSRQGGGTEIDVDGQ